MMSKKYITKSFIVNFLIFFCIFLLDRFTKKIVIILDGKNFGEQIYTSSYLNIQLIWNQGIAFGLFSNIEKFLYNILSIIIIIIIFVIIIMILKNNGIKRMSLIFILGGAAGNLYDRVLFSAVPDFLDFHIRDFHWFIFNIADIFISVGVILLIFIDLFGNKEKENE